MGRNSSGIRTSEQVSKAGNEGDPEGSRVRDLKYKYRGGLRSEEEISAIRESESSQGITLDHLHAMNASRDR